MGTTLYCDPLGGTLEITKTLGGMFVAPALPGQKVIRIDWPNNKENGAELMPSSAAHYNIVINLKIQIAAALPTATAADPVRVVGQSGGGQGIERFLREEGAWLLALLTSLGKTIDCIIFYVLGSPETKFTGASYLYPAQSKPIYPGDGTKCGKNGGAHDSTCPSTMANHGGFGVGYGLPINCPFIVNMVIIQYDGWAMAPTTPAHSQLTKLFDLWIFGLPRQVWNQSIACYMKSGEGPHGEYDAKDSKTLSHPDVFTFKDNANSQHPNVYYRYIRRYPFPGYDKIKAIRFLARNKDMTTRASIDAAFAATSPTRGMQITIPAPDYNTVASWFPLS